MRAILAAMSSDSQGRKIGYWVATGLAAAAFSFSAFMDFQAPAEMVEGVEHLGYPLYLLPLLGVAKALAVITMLAPRFARLKEWAYAGIAIDMIGASYSHAMAGDGAQQIITPMVFLALAMSSYFLRPADRRLPDLPAKP